MDKVTGNKAVIASGANFKGQIKNTPAIEINGTVEADIKAEKLTQLVTVVNLLGRQMLNLW